MRLLYIKQYLLILIYMLCFFLLTMKYILFYTLPSDCSGQRHKLNLFKNIDYSLN